MEWCKKAAERCRNTAGQRGDSATLPTGGWSSTSFGCMFTNTRIHEPAAAAPNRRMQLENSTPCTTIASLRNCKWSACPQNAPQFLLSLFPFVFVRAQAGPHSGKWGSIPLARATLKLQNLTQTTPSVTLTRTLFERAVRRHKQ